MDGLIGQLGQEIVFSADQLFFCLSGMFDSFDFDGNRVFRNTVVTPYHDDSPQPAVHSSGVSYVEWWSTLQSYDADGNFLWTAVDEPFGVTIRTPDVGPDGTIYIARGFDMYALRANGSQKWSRFTYPDGYSSSIVSPDGNTIVVSGGGQGPSFFRALRATNGAELWNFDLPTFTTTQALSQGRARFSADGSVVYVMAAIDSSTSYIYALQVN